MSQLTPVYSCQKVVKSRKIGAESWFEYLIHVKDLTFDKFEPSWCGGWTRLAGGLA